MWGVSFPIYSTLHVGHPTTLVVRSAEELLLNKYSDTGHATDHVDNAPIDAKTRAVHSCSDQLVVPLVGNIGQ